MSMDAGACGMYGILLCDVTDPLVKTIYEEFQTKVKDAAEANDYPSDVYSDVTVQEWYADVAKRLFEAFAALGVKVPSEAWLGHTGTENDRPARCGTPTDAWIFGLSMFTRPDQWPRLDSSFVAASEMHTWVWMS